MLLCVVNSRLPSAMSVKENHCRQVSRRSSRAPVLASNLQDLTSVSRVSRFRRMLFAELSHLQSTLTRPPESVAKQTTLTFLESTLTKPYHSHSKQRTSSRLESTLTQYLKLSPVVSTLTQNRGGVKSDLRPGGSASSWDRHSCWCSCDCGASAGGAP
jgi:hypothetical protein